MTIRSVIRTIPAGNATRLPLAGIHHGIGASPSSGGVLSLFSNPREALGVHCHQT